MNVLHLIKLVFETLFKAPTLFTYSVIVWLRKIDSHKVFCCVIFQACLVITLAIMYALTPAATDLGCISMIITLILVFVFGYFFMGAPKTNEEWDYVIKGNKDKFNEIHQQQVQELNRRRIQQQQSKRFNVEEDYVPVVNEPVKPDLTTQREMPVYESVVQEEPEVDKSSEITEEELRNLANEFDMFNNCVNIKAIDGGVTEDKVENITQEDLTKIANDSEDIDKSEVESENSSNFVNIFDSEDLQWNSSKNNIKEEVKEEVKEDLSNVLTDDVLAQEIKLKGIDNDDNAINEVSNSFVAGQLLGDIEDDEEI